MPQDKRRFVIDHAGSHHRCLDQLDQLWRVDSELLRQNKRLGKAFIDQGDHQIHAELGSLTFAGIADVDDLLAHGFEERIEIFDRLVRAPDDENELSVFCADF